MKYFIDLGANVGDSLRHFDAKLKLRDGTWTTYAWEPNPACHRTLRRLQREWGGSLHLIPQAAWIWDGVLTFHQERRGRWWQRRRWCGVGSSHIRRTGRAVQVPCSDLAAWLQALGKADVVVVKMDIEGAEYQVLDRLLTTGAASLIHTLHCEFHGHLLGWMDWTEEARLKESLRRTLTLRPWW